MSDLLDATAALVVAAHPDDEALGCGGLIAGLAERGVTVAVLFVTDGGASHPSSRAWPRRRLAAQRAEEAAAALEALGAAGAARLHLDLPDAGIDRGSEAWATALTRAADFAAAVAPDLLVTPWRRDPHRDHRDAHVLGVAAAARAGLRPRLLEYAIWLDEIGDDADRPRPNEVTVRRLDIGPWRARKRAAVAAHRSQLGLVVEDDPTGFVLSEGTVRRLTAGPETFFEANG